MDGTHTSSTSAGGRAQHADYFGYAEGTATGIAPMARIAMYKVLFYTGEGDDSKAAATDALAGMDQAIEDGIDIMSLSLGFFETPFYENPIAIGGYAALKKGIFVACSAGNASPHGYTMLNGAPWITTVGAGTIDRMFGAEITLGDGVMTITGTSIYPKNLFVDRFPFYFGLGNRSKEICGYDSLDPKKVEGKFLFCDSDESSSLLFQLTSENENDRSGPDIAGAIGGTFREDDAEFLHLDYFPSPIVIVKPGTIPAPKVAYFSSRGLDVRSPWILKPDVRLFKKTIICSQIMHLYLAHQWHAPM